MWDFFSLFLCSDVYARPSPEPRNIVAPPSRLPKTTDVGISETNSCTRFRQSYWSRCANKFVRVVYDSMIYCTSESPGNKKRTTDKTVVVGTRYIRHYLGITYVFYFFFNRRLYYYFLYLWYTFSYF